MSNIRKSLLQTIFSGFTMRRWNDRLRPTELCEIDKQAHKMIVAFLLASCVHAKDEEERLALFHDIIENALFDYFYRIVTTDLKPPLFYQIKSNKKHYEELTNYVITALKPILTSFNHDFFERFKAYHKGEKKNTHPLTQSILKASHLFASQWEFNLIKDLNIFDKEIENINQDFIDQLNALTKLEGLEELQNIINKENALGDFAHFCGQLRFQLRWSQEVRIPLTSVLGHMFFVASMAYFVSLDINACKKRSVNNFFCGLFHDLPELLTRDIITPVKNSSLELPDFIKEYEHQELENKIFIPLREAGYTSITESLSYLLGLDVNGEFTNCYSLDNKVVSCSIEELQEKYNMDCYNPKDGELIKSCDMLGAFLEANSSLKHGLKSQALVEASIRIQQNIMNPMPELIDFKALLADFD